MIKLEVEKSLLDYAVKPNIHFDMKKALNEALISLSKEENISFSKIVLREGSPMIPYARYNPKENSLEIFIFSRLFYPHYGKKNRDSSMYYIIKHEIKEALLRKPSKIYEIVNETFTYFLPDYVNQKLEYCDESLILHCQNVCSDIVVDKSITLDDDKSGKGFLVVHNLGYGIDKDLRINKVYKL